MIKTRKARKTETAEQRLERWLAGSVKGFGYDKLMATGWEPGQVGHITVGDANYEMFPVNDGYVVIEWTEEGDVSVS